MPNHCDSDLIVLGDPALLDEVLSKFFTEKGELNCDAVIPYPNNFKRLDEAAEAWDKENKDNPKADWSLRPVSGFEGGGYDWCLTNWGTKWGTYDGDGVARGPRSFTVRFSSAWSPPAPAIARLAEMYPSLRFTLDSYESGMAYHYHAVWKDGTLLEESDGEYHGLRGG